MRGVALLLALALSAPAWAADDAPVVLAAGDIAPVAGVLLPDAVAVDRARELVACRIERDALKGQPPPMPPLVVVGLVVLGVVAGGAAGYGIAVATKVR